MKMIKINIFMVMLIQIMVIKNLILRIKNFQHKSDGIAYFEDKKNRCEVNSQSRIYKFPQ